MTTEELMAKAEALETSAIREILHHARCCGYDPAALDRVCTELAAITTLSRALSEKDAEIARLRAALISIAMNTCCRTCQEAALVAEAALTARPAASQAETVCSEPMKLAGARALRDSMGWPNHTERAAHCYAAMIAAAHPQGGNDNG